MDAGLAEELRQHIFAASAAFAGRRAHWEMDGEWLTDVLRLDDSRGRMWERLPDGKVWLLGRRVQIRAGSGPPHLEPDI